MVIKAPRRFIIASLPSATVAVRSLIVALIRWSRGGRWVLSATVTSAHVANHCLNKLHRNRPIPFGRPRGLAAAGTSHHMRYGFANGVISVAPSEGAPGAWAGAQCPSRLIHRLVIPAVVLERHRIVPKSRCGPSTKRAAGLNNHTQHATASCRSPCPGPFRSLFQSDRCWPDAGSLAEPRTPQKCICHKAAFLET